MKMKERNTQPTRDNSPEIFLRSKEGDQGGNGPLLGSQQIRNWVQKKGTLQCIFAWSWQVRGLDKALLPNELHIFTWLSLSLHVLDHGVWRDRPPEELGLFSIPSRQSRAGLAIQKQLWPALSFPALCLVILCLVLIFTLLIYPPPLFSPLSGQLFGVSKPEKN